MKHRSLVVVACAGLFLTVMPGCKKLISAAADAGATGTEPKDAPPKETGTKFTKKNPAAGQKRTDDTHSEMKLKLKLLGKEMKLDETENKKKDEEVLEAAGAAITKMKVTYTQNEKIQSENDKPAKTKPSAIAGKTYILTLKDGKLVVLNDKEKPAPKNEASLVEKDYHSFGKADPMLAAIPDRALKDGEELPELGEALKQELMSSQKSGNGKDEKLTVDAVKVVFKGKEGDVGLFDVSLNMKADAAFMKMSMPLTGKMSLRVNDAWPASLTMDGPINLDLTDKDKQAGVEGSGTLKIASTYTYK
jgi:hypothetical protein